jgi:hypothetical protein
MNAANALGGISPEVLQRGENVEEVLVRASLEVKRIRQGT